MEKTLFNPENQLSKHGWTAGSGLGRDEDGIKEAIKVKLKFDQTGVGHNVADQFTFHWWDHTFNQAANNIEVKQTQQGVEIKSTGKLEEISSKKKTVNVQKADMMYGMFVKSSTLTMEGESKESNTLNDADSDSSSDSDSDLEGADVGTASKLTDEQLMKICGGRTAHKGARHGLRLNGKLARIAEQESIYCENTTKSSSDNTEPSSPPASLTLSQPSNMADGAEAKKDKKKKKSRKVYDDDDNVGGLKEPSKKKRKKESKLRDLKIVNDSANDYQVIHDEMTGDTDVSIKKKSKKKSKSRDVEIVGDDGDCRVTDTYVIDLPKKKSKKKSKSRDVEIVGDDGDCRVTDTYVIDLPKKKSKKKSKSRDVEIVGDDGDCRVTDTYVIDLPKKKCKKKSKSKDVVDKILTKVNQSGMETTSSKKKKKSKSKDHMIAIDDSFANNMCNIEIPAKKTKKSSKRDNTHHIENNEIVESIARTITNSDDKGLDKKRKKKSKKDCD